MKVAIVCIVKNEATEIAYWLAWYKRIGADTVFVYDDGSTDGTAEIAEDAAALFDVRVTRLGSRAGRFEVRQREVYIDVITQQRDHYDWIGFFDVDEYLAVYQDGDVEAGDIKKFLQRPDDVGAVAVHWCNYGANEWVVDSGGPSFGVYTRHSTPHEGINCHIKSLIRPTRWTGHWKNVHHFDVGISRYVYPSGRDVHWERDGITVAEVEWDHAKIMHFQLRSMENFVDRMKKRPDITASTHTWKVMDYSDLEDTRPLGVIRAVMQQIRRHDRISARRVVEQVSIHPVSPIYAPDNRIEAPGGHDILLRKLVGHFGRTLSWSAIDGIVAVEENPLVPVACLSVKSMPGSIFLYWPEHDAPEPYIMGDFRTTRMRRFTLFDLDHEVALINPQTRKFMGIKPPDYGGQAVADIFQPNDWERFTLQPADEKLLDWARNDPGLAFLISTAAAGEATLRPETIETWFDVLPLLSECLTPKDRDALEAGLGASGRRLF